MVRMNDSVQLVDGLESKFIDADYKCADSIIQHILQKPINHFRIFLEEELPAMHAFLNLMRTEGQGGRRTTLIHNVVVLNYTELTKFISEAKTNLFNLMNCMRREKLFSAITALIRPVPFPKKDTPRTQRPWLERVHLPIQAVDDFKKYKERTNPDVDEASQLIFLLRNFTEHFYQIDPSKCGKERNESMQ